MSNRLASEISPYLLQHKDNPVDWYPWGDEAFSVAADRNCPIFLSIGYATCHWCHVMEHESFENGQIASLMNQSFVAIKVDREERPDIDAVFMSVCQMAGGQCGWPLNVLLTPEGTPFFVTTYLPPESRHGRIGMVDFVERVSEAWVENSDDIRTKAQEIQSHLLQQSKSREGDVDASWFRTAVDQLRERYDRDNGGFSDSPKFPSPHILSFLMKRGESDETPTPSEMVTSTLRAMRRGGIYDHVGFGFHRYATDSKWILPHFEKMLYDQAMHCRAYAQAYANYGDAEFKRTVMEIVGYLNRDLSDESGAFYSAEDADSEGEEGLFYLWTTEELLDLLSDDASEFATRYNCEAPGNYLDEATRIKTGRNVLFLDRKASAIPTPETTRSLDKLRLARQARERPLLDDKILTDWNGLMIAALAEAGRLVSEPTLVERAARAYHAVRSLLVTDDGRILHRYRNGVAGIQGTVEDYSALTSAALSLYDATRDVSYLREGVQTQTEQDRLFADDRSGGYYQTAIDAEQLLVRLKDFSDGAMPSANAFALGNLTRLFSLTGIEAYRKKAEALMRAAAPQVSTFPSAFTGLLLQYEPLLESSTQVVIACGQMEDARAAIELLDSRPVPNLVVHVVTDTTRSDLSRLAPYTASLPIQGVGPTFYVCSNFVCELPTNAIGTLADSLQAIYERTKSSATA